MVSLKYWIFLIWTGLLLQLISHLNLFIFISPIASRPVNRLKTNTCRWVIIWLGKRVPYDALCSMCWDFTRLIAWSCSVLLLLYFKGTVFFPNTLRSSLQCLRDVSSPLHMTSWGIMVPCFSVDIIQFPLAKLQFCVTWVLACKRFICHSVGLFTPCISCLPSTQF